MFHSSDVAPHQRRWLLEDGIHYIAGLRFLLSAAGQRISHVTASPVHLQRADKTLATMQLANGNSGTFGISPETDPAAKFVIEVVTDQGGVTVLDTHCLALTKNEQMERPRRMKPSTSDNGVKRMIAAFADSIGTGREDVRGSPTQALEDLKIVDAIVKSAEDGGKTVLVE